MGAFINNYAIQNYNMSMDIYINRTLYTKIVFDLSIY